MNASARALAQGTFSGHNFRQMILTSQMIFVSVLMCLVLVTAFGVIYVKDATRRQVIELHTLQHQHDQMLMDQSRLLLEENTWSSPIRIQQVANQLNMAMPAKNTIVFVK